MVNSEFVMSAVNENYFEFGFKLIKKIASALTKDKLENDIHASEEGKKSIMKDIELRDEFMDISRKHNNQFLKKVDGVNNVYEELIEKTINARFSEENRE